MMFISRLSHFSCIIGAVLMALAGVMLTYEVCARYFFVKPTIWAAELSQLCLIWGCMLAMAHLLQIRQHITVNAVTSLLSPKLQKYAAGFALLMIIAMAFPVLVYGWSIFHDSFQRGRTTGSLLDLPVWVSELAIPVGFALLIMQAVVELCRLPTTTNASLGGMLE